ncbi:hypothetical protein [Metabacillus endolithicus]
MVDQYGGSIDVQSNKHSTTFEINIPIKS